MKRSAGILLALSSLPSAYGIGCFDSAAYRFVDWLKEASQSYWQILPLGHTSYGDSPYQSFSSFAGNPYYISLDALIEEGLLTKKECEAADLVTKEDQVDYSKQYQNRYSLLKKAYKNSRIQNDASFDRFLRENTWLEDYALFMAIKERHGGTPWNLWDKELKFRDPRAIRRFRERNASLVGFYQFLQYHFDNGWQELKAYANQNGIQIIGDIPIYVAYDSADTWASPDLFQLDQNKTPLAVAGCPPDGFSENGQLWGNPLYDWKKHEATGYRWWISRLAHSFRLYDAVRIDHFRGFDEYYSIPYGEKTAKNGHWEKGPGIALFQALKAALGEHEVIVEDLGFMTDSVRKLVSDTGYPNMKVLEFAFDSRDSGSGNDHLPHNYPENCVAYTGTHDNQTLLA